MHWLKRLLAECRQEYPPGWRDGPELPNDPERRMDIGVADRFYRWAARKCGFVS
jgi:hypothetical protein